MAWSAGYDPMRQFHLRYGFYKTSGQRRYDPRTPVPGNAPDPVSTLMMRNRCQPNSRNPIQVPTERRAKLWERNLLRIDSDTGEGSSAPPKPTAAAPNSISPSRINAGLAPGFLFTVAPSRGSTHERAVQPFRPGSSFTFHEDSRKGSGEPRRPLL